MILDWIESVLDVRPKWRDEKYEVFCSELKKICEPLLDSQVADSFLGDLYAILGESFSPKKRYKLFLLKLRSLLLVSEKPSSALFHVVRGFYSISMKSFCHSLLLELLNFKSEFPFKEVLSVEDILPIFEWSYKKLASVPYQMTSKVVSREIFRVRSALGMGFDPYLLGNLPYYLFSLDYCDESGVIYRMDNIRMGCVTIEPCMFMSAKVTPEYHALMQHYKDKGQTHLYVNLQNRNPPVLNKVLSIHNERNRVRALERKTKEFDNFILVSLSKDSEFYHQKGRFQDPIWKDAAYFKQYFIETIFLGEDPAFWFPRKCVEDPAFLDEIRSLLDDIHEECFFSEPLLTLPERLDFIEILWVRLTDYFLKKVKPRSFNQTCRDCIDRGAASNTLMLYYQLLQENYSFTPEVVLFLLSVAFVPSFFVRKREMRASRFQRMISAMRRLSHAFKSKALKKSVFKLYLRDC